MALAIEKFGETFGISSLHRGSGTESHAKGLSPPDPDGFFVEAFLISTLVVGLAEIGDKTQILSFMLAARFQRPVPIIFGILFATLANPGALAGYRIETVWPSRQALTPRLTRCDPLSKTVFTSTRQLSFRSSTSTDTDLPGSRNSEPSKSSCQLPARSSER